jgi:hypothetical protein
MSIRTEKRKRTLETSLAKIEDWFKARGNEWASLEEIMDGVQFTSNQVKYVLERFKGGFEKRYTPGRGRGSARYKIVLD